MVEKLLNRSSCLVKFCWLGIIAHRIRSADNMAVGHAVRSSGLIRLTLATLLLYSGILVTILKQLHTPLRLDDGFSAILPDNAVVARNCNFTSSRWVNRHIVSRLIVRKRFSSTRVNYYPNSVASYQISFLQLKCI